MNFRHAARAAIASTLVGALMIPAPAGAQDLGTLPIPDLGAVGELLDPVGDLVDEILGTIDPGLRDLPLDNAVRLLADDAVDAAIALSQATFETSDVVMIGRDDIFADSLSSVAAQGIIGAPLLLTQTDAIDERVAAEIARLGATEVIILGNESAISEAVEAQLRESFEVSRAGGPTRIETAIELAQLVAPDADTAIIVRAYPSEGADQSQAYADALAAGPFGSLEQIPVLLTTSEDIHPATMSYIEDAGIENVFIIGGENAISLNISELLEGLLSSVTRIAGPNRAATAIAIANQMGFTTAADSSRLILTEVAGDTDPLWAAGYAAAAHAAVFEAPIIPSTGAILPPETLVYLLSGLLDNALRLGNEPLICNSFVNILACEAAALLLVGLLDEVDALLGGALSDLLGEAGLQDLLDQLSGILPGADGLSPAMITDLVEMLGLPAGSGLDDLAALPQTVQDSLVGLLGTEGNRPSGSEQAVITDLLGQLTGLLGGATVNTDNPTQAAAIADVFAGMGDLLGNDGAEMPFGEAEALLGGVASLVQELTGTLDLDALGGLVDGLGIDGDADVVAILGMVAGLLSQGGDPGQLTEAFGEPAAGLADVVGQLLGAFSS